MSKRLLQKPVRAFPLSYSKGQLSTAVFGTVTLLVILFVGLFMFQRVGDIQSQSQLYDYSYTSVNNTTSGVLHNGNRVTYWFTVNDVKTITGEDADDKITIKVINTSAAGDNANATLNGVSLGTWTVTGNSTAIFGNPNFLKNQLNNVTVGYANTTEVNITANWTDIKYPSGTSNTGFGDIFSGLITNAGTTYDVIVLVAIIVALGVAIGVLQRFTGGGPAVAV